MGEIARGAPRASPAAEGFLMAPQPVSHVRISRVSAPYETLVVLDFSSIPHVEPVVSLKDGVVQIAGSTMTWSLQELAGCPFNASSTWLEGKGPVVLIHAPYRSDETLHFG